MKNYLNSTMIKITLMIVLCMSVFAFSGVKVQAKDEAIDLRAKAAILIDADSGKILYEKNANKAYGIASMSKMMTEYILLDKIKAGEISWDDQYNVSKYAFKISHDTELSNVALREDGVYTVKELYEAMAIYSANAATIALTEVMAGSEKNFLPLMNKKAEELGLKNYTFYNSTGLNNKQLKGMQPKGTPEDGENEMPAKYVAKLAYQLVKDHPEILKTASINKKAFAKGTDDEIMMTNWNYMVKGGTYEYEGVDGLKTGSTDFAGQCVTITAKQGDLRVIAVVMDAKEDNGDSTYKARFDAAKTLLDYGFNNFEMQEIMPAGYTFKKNETIAVKDGKKKEVAIEASKAISFVANKNTTYKPKIVLDKKEITAPVKKGTVVGHVEVQGDGYGYIMPSKDQVTVVTTQDVQSKGWFIKALGGIGDFFVNIWNSIF